MSAKENFKYIKGFGGGKPKPATTYPAYEDKEGLLYFDKSYSSLQIGTAKDLLSEGPIDGLVEGEYSYSGMIGNLGYGEVIFSAYPVAAKSATAVRFLRSIFWDGIPIVDSANNYNFQYVNVKYTLGNPGGGISQNIGFPTSSFTKSIGDTLRGISNEESARDWVRTYRVVDPHITSLAFNFKIQSLYVSLKYQDLSLTVADLQSKISEDIITANKSAGNFSLKVLGRDASEAQLFADKIEAGVGSVIFNSLKLAILFTPLYEGFISKPTINILDTASFNKSLDANEEIELDTSEKLLNLTFKGKITEGYSRQVLITLPSDRDPAIIGWDISILKTTPEDISRSKATSIFLDSITENYSFDFLYPNSAILNCKFNSAFFSRIPERTFDVKLLKVKVPSNYNTLLRTYGVTTEMISTEKVSDITPGSARNDLLNFYFGTNNEFTVSGDLCPVSGGLIGRFDARFAVTGLGSNAITSWPNSVVNAVTNPGCLDLQCTIGNALHTSITPTVPTLLRPLKNSYTPNGLTGINFSATNMKVRFSNFASAPANEIITLDASKEYSIFAVCKWNNAADYVSRKEILEGYNNDNGKPWKLGFNNACGNRYFQFGAYINTSPIWGSYNQLNIGLSTTAVTSLDDSMYVVGVTSKTNLTTMYWQNEKYTVKKTATPPLGLSINKTLKSICSLFELLIYKKSLSDIESRAVVSWLQKKWCTNYIGLTNANIVADKGLLGDGHFCLKTDGCSLSIPIKTHAYDGAMTKNSKVAGSIASTDFNGSQSGPGEVFTRTNAIYSELQRSNHLIDHQDFFYKGFDGGFDWLIGDHGHCSFYCSFHLKLIDASVIDDTEYNLIHRQGQFSLSFKTTKTSATGASKLLAMVHLILRIFTPTGVRTVIKETKYTKSEFLNGYKKIIFHIIPRIIKTNLKYTEPTNVVKYGIYSLIDTISFQNDPLYYSPISAYPFYGSKADLKTAIWMQDGVEPKHRLYVYDYFPTILGSQINVLINDDTEIRVSLNPGNYLSYKDYMGNVDEVPGGKPIATPPFNTKICSNWRFFRSKDSGLHATMKNINTENSSFLLSLIAPPCLNIIRGTNDNLWNFGGWNNDLYVGATLRKYEPLNPGGAPLFLTWKNGYESWYFGDSETHDRHFVSFYGEGNFTAAEVTQMKNIYPNHNIDPDITSISDALQNNPTKISNIDSLYGKSIFSKGQQALNRFNNLAENGILATTPVNTDIKNLNSDGLTVNLSNLQKEVVMAISSADMYPRSSTDNTNSACNRTHVNRELFTSFSPYNYIFCTGNLEIFSDKQIPGYGGKLVAFIDELTVDTINFSPLDLASINNNIYFNKSLTANKKTTYTTTPSAYTASNDLWDGTFKDDKEWTNNPAWCFYDLLTNKRYGAGNYIKESDVDKWSLYRVAKYCDELVSDGAGGVEPRFTCNTYITSQEDALKVLGDMASIFRGMFYYANGLISTINDMPSETSIYTFTNANVVGGDFSYESSSLKDRNSAVYVRYIDKTKSHKPGVEYVENVEAIRKFGLKETELTAFGCTSRGQAQRLGRWLLSSDYNETETITFQTGPEAVYLKPGDVVKVYDYNKKYKTVGGRLNSIVLSGIDNTSAFGAMTGFFGLDRKLDFNFSDPQKVYKFSILAPKMNLDPSVNGAVLSSRDISEYRNPLVSSTFISGSNLTTGANYDTIKISGLTSMLTGFNQFNITGLRLFTGVTGISPASLVWSLENSGSLDGATDSDYDFYRLFRIQEGQNSEYTLLGAQVYNLKYTQIENGLNIVSFSTNPQALSPDSASFAVNGATVILTINYAGSQKSVNSNFKVFKKSSFTNFNPATDLNFITVNIDRMTNLVTTTIQITSADAGVSFRVYGNNAFNLISTNFIQPTDSNNVPTLPELDITKIALSSTQKLSINGGSFFANLNPISLKRTDFIATSDFAFVTPLDAFSMDTSSIISNGFAFRIVIIPEKVLSKAAFKTAYDKYNTNSVFYDYCSEESSSDGSFKYGTSIHLSKFRNFSIGIDLSKDNNTINSSNDFAIQNNFILITYDNEDGALLTNLTSFANAFDVLKLTTDTNDPNNTVVNYKRVNALDTYIGKVYLLLLPSDSSFGFNNISGLEKRINYIGSLPKSISIAKYDRFVVQTAALIDSTTVILKAGSQTISVNDFITFDGDFTKYKITNISSTTLTIDPGLKFALAADKLVTILNDQSANWTEILDSHFIDVDFASEIQISTSLDLNNRPFKLTKYRIYFIGLDKFTPTPTNPLDHTSKYLNNQSTPIESKVYPFIYSPNKLLTTLTFGAYDAEILLNNLGSNYLHFTLNKTSIISYTRPLETTNDNFTTGYNNITLGYLVTKPTSGVNISTQGGSLGGLDKTLLKGDNSTVGQKVSGYQLCIASRPTLSSMGTLAIPENNKRSFLLNGNKIFTNALRVNDINDSVYGISTPKLAAISEAGDGGIPSHLNASFSTQDKDNGYSATSSNLYFMKPGNDDSAFFGDNGKELFDLNIAHITNFSGTTSNAQDPNSLYSKVTGQGLVVSNKCSTNQVSGSYKSLATSAASTTSLYASMNSITNPFATNILGNSSVFNKPFNILDVTPLSNIKANSLGDITNSCGVPTAVFPTSAQSIITRTEFDNLNPSPDTLAGGWIAITVAAGLAATAIRTHYFGIPYISSLPTFNFTINIASVATAKNIALYCFYGDLEISSSSSFKIGTPGAPVLGGGTTASLPANSSTSSIIVTIPTLIPNNYYTYSNNNNIDSPIGRLSADFPNYWFYKFKEPKSLSFAHVMTLGKGPAAAAATMNYAAGQYTMPRNNHYIQAFELSIIIAILPA